MTIKGNKIGTDVGATSAWANLIGIKLSPDNLGKEPTGVLIDNNIIAGNEAYGINSTIKEKVEMRNNHIGVNINGLPVPNKHGATFENTASESHDDTFAPNSETGLAVYGNQAVTVVSPSIYENGDETHLEGFIYENPPIAEPSKVFALRYRPDENNRTRVLIAVAPPKVANATVEIFGNRSTTEFQGRTALDRGNVVADQPFLKEWELSADSSIALMDNFTAIYTIGGKTSEFSEPAEVQEVIVPDLRMSAPVDNRITLSWSLLEYFRITSSPNPEGPWEPIDLDPEKANGLYTQEIELTESAQFFRLELDITAVFDYN
ncbi:right-handed parallel beta-helix repeat-containing protein [Pelagicoccus sp. SDUM812002]|uniref:right-handed parallel beta-helix repeat-containing protein n=1 Tax=Pelagicoccus sp. SDUM812002 TaxID=3041266 RepID=UPI00280C5B98|nr:right-handed parallel beta-helix repeat-containing protein [Pelagicoccus sp. SDUM812002]MDQ8187097.1 right-handed parallel beta-helix repeat-containing protein [Pelagicoccus sp. SDUM812002]